MNRVIAAARRWLVLWAVLVMVSPGGTLREQHWCRMLGLIQPEACCCATDALEHLETLNVEGSTTQLEREDCCDNLSSIDEALLASTREPAPQLTALVAVNPAFTMFAFPARLIEEQAPPREARSTRAIGPPLFLVHCALLT